MTIAKLSRSLTAGLAALVVAGGVIAAPPGAGAATDERVEQVTLALTPADPAGLAALAHARSGSQAARAAALRRVVPSARARADVAAQARRLGLHVDAGSTWAVRVSGRATLIRQLFGSARHNDSASRFAHNLPALPTAFRGRVAAVFGGDETRPAFEHFLTGPHGGWSGADVRAQYLAAPGAVSGTQTIATVQLSDWHASDLANYAAGQSLPAPAPGQYTAIKDAGDPPVLTTDLNDPSYGNDVEVDLDQEAIYGIDPTANQRAYLSGNDLAGMYDDLAALGDDATNPLTDGYHITAASISWGACEDPSPGAAPMYDAYENVLRYVVAAGVTVFAASGDAGGDCAAGTPGVSYPASSPEVVAVGGTQPSAIPQTLPVTEQGWSGSGGGFSHLFYAPAWQTVVGKRAVPDIASAAAIPYEVYTTSPSSAELWTYVGGTSLSAPTAAALLSYELGRHGYSWGLGDIHAALYGTARSAITDIVTGTQANSGASAGAGWDAVTGLGTPQWDAVVTQLRGDPHLSVPQYYTNSLTPPVAVHTADFAGQAFVGYRLILDDPAQCAAYGTSAAKPTVADFASLGAPPGYWDGPNSLILAAVDSQNLCHFASSEVFIDTQHPTAHASATLTSATSGTHVTAKWSMTDPAPSSGLGHYAVSIVNQSGTTVYSAASTTATSATIAASQGATYTVRVTAVDKAGNASAQATGVYTVPVDDAHFTYSAAWSRGSSTSAYSGSYHVSSHTGLTASYTATARTYVLWAVTGPSAGRAAIYVGSTYVKTIDLYASATHWRVAFTLYSSATRATRKIVVKVSGTKASASHGYAVYVDALQSTP